MSRICPNCKSEIPEEAHFCLKCFSSVDETGPVSKPVNKKAELKKDKSKKKNRIIPIIKSKQFKAASACILGVFLLCFGSVMLKKWNNTIVPVAADEITMITVTEENGEAVTTESGEVVTQAVVAVTDKNGEAVTEKDGSAVFKAVEAVTDKNGENVTDKNGSAVYAIVADNSGKDASASEATTEKKSLFDKLFGKDDDKTDETSTTLKEGSATTEKATESTAAETSNTQAQNTQTTTSPSPSTTHWSWLQPQTTEPQSVASADDFEYVYTNNLIEIKKYNGSAANVVVPAKINGSDVSYISTNAFKDNANVKSVTFEDGAAVFNLSKYSSVSSPCFVNMPNLESIKFPSGTTSKENIYSLFSNCPKLRSVTFGSGCTAFKVIDDVVFKGSKLAFYPYAKTTENYTTPDSCYRIEYRAVRDNPYIKSFCLGKNIPADNLSSNFMGCSSLERITVDPANPHSEIQSDGGVLYLVNCAKFSDDIQFSSEPFTLVCYPAGKRDTSYTFIENYKISLSDSTFCGNPYIQEIKLSEYTHFNAYSYYTYGPKNLKIIHMKDNDYSRTQYNRSYNLQRNYSVDFY